MRLPKTGPNPLCPRFCEFLAGVKGSEKHTGILALKMEKSGLRTAAKLLGDLILIENAVFLLKKREIAAFVVADKSGYFYA